MQIRFVAFAGIILVVFLVLSGRFLTSSKSASSPNNVDSTEIEKTTSESTTGKAPTLQETVARLKNNAAQVVKQREPLVTHNEGKLPPGYTQETVTLARDVIQEMWAVRGLVNTHQLRQDAGRRLLAAPQSLDLIYDTVTDPQFAKDVFGELQAEARYYSIRIFAQAAAENGQQDRLLDAVGVVGERVISAETHDKGQGEDFRGLLTAYLEAIEIDQINQQLMLSLGYDSSTLSEEMRQIFFETVFSVLWKRVGLEQAQLRLRIVFPEG